MKTCVVIFASFVVLGVGWIIFLGVQPSIRQIKVAVLAPGEQYSTGCEVNLPKSKAGWKLLFRCEDVNQVSNHEVSVFVENLDLGELHLRDNVTLKKGEACLVYAGGLNSLIVHDSPAEAPWLYLDHAVIRAKLTLRFTEKTFIPNNMIILARSEDAL